VLSAAAAILHIAIIFGGPDWYLFFGAGEGMARAAACGLVRPALFAVGIAAILLIWSAYAMSGAGIIRRLPLLRAGLVVISAIYLLRGLVLLPILLVWRDYLSPFAVWSSLIVLAYGIVYAIGTRRAWSRLAPEAS
jgi:hypothetical protein